MNKLELFRAWGRVLTGYHPSISVEITRECPLRCPGCYAYEPEHLGKLGPLQYVAKDNSTRRIRDDKEWERM